MAGGACRWTVVGNPAMMQLLCGMPVDGLGRAPFTPAYRAAIEKDGAYVGPLISGFVGADAVSAALFAGLDQGNATRLLLDVGTLDRVFSRTAAKLAPARRRLARL